MKIYVSKNDEIYKEEVKNKGWRDDVYVFINNKYYKIFIYEKMRFIQDYDESISSMQAYVPEPNTIFVESVTNECIVKTIKICSDEDYFEYLKPCEVNEVNELTYEFSEKYVSFLKKNKLLDYIKIKNLIPIYSD